MFLYAAILFSFLAFSCASNKKVPPGEFFYEENVFTFKEAALSNGIPVVIKNIPFEKNIQISLLFDGGASSCPNAKSGIDQFVFELIGESNPKIKELLARGLYFCVSECKADYSSYGFSSYADDFFENYEIFASSILKPEYSHDDYIKKESSEAAGALARSENPRFVLLNAARHELYSSSPYKEGFFYRPSSRVSEYDIEKHLASLMNASRIKIVAAGNFSYRTRPQKGERREKKSEAILFAERSDLLLQKLEESFGALKASDWTAPDTSFLSIKGSREKRVNSEFAGGDFYSALCFECPNRGDEDYEAFALCTIALDELLSREFVEKQKTTAYCGVATLNSKRSAALIIASGKNKQSDFLTELKGAFKNYPQEYDLSRALEMYKRIYVSRILGASQNAGATVEQIASSLCYEDDPKSFISRPKKIRAVTVQDVIDAFEKYFLTENSLYVLLTN